MSEKTQAKMFMRIDDATRAVIAVLASVERNHAGSFITKEALFPRIITKVEDNIAESDLLIYDEQAIPAPDDSFLLRRWSQICDHAARQYKKYIVWCWDGVRLGTLEEYQENQKDLAKSTQGLADKIDDRTNIIIAHGGQSFMMTVGIKYLSSGNEIIELDDA